MSQQSSSEASPEAYEPADPERPATAQPAEEDILGGPGAKARHDPYAALRSPGFVWYEAGSFLAVVGQQLQSVAVGWDIFQRTHRAISLGWVGLAGAAPVVLLALPAGQLADRFDRKRLIVVTQVFAAASSAWLAALSARHGSVGAMYAALFASACAAAVGQPARSALLPGIVPAESFANAVTWNSSLFQVASVVGPAVGGLIIVRAVWPAYLIDALCAAAFGVFAALIPLRRTPPPRQPATLKNLAAGIQFVRRTEVVLATLTLDLFAVLLGGATYLLPIFASDVLGVDSFRFGCLRAAPAVGACLMAVVMAHRPPMKKAGRAMLWAVAGFGVATIAFGLSRNYWLSLAMLLLTGAFDNISVLVRHTLVQVLTPDAMRGRVSAVNNVFIGASNELGGLESGLTAAAFGATGSVVGGGVGTLLVVAAVAVIWPRLREFGSLHDAAMENAPDHDATDPRPSEAAS